jgi:hypothetical protein
MKTGIARQRQGLVAINGPIILFKQGNSGFLPFTELSEKGCEASHNPISVVSFLGVGPEEVEVFSA